MDSLLRLDDEFRSLSLLRNRNSAEVPSANLHVTTDPHSLRCDLSPKLVCSSSTSIFIILMLFLYISKQHAVLLWVC